MIAWLRHRDLNPQRLAGSPIPRSIALVGASGRASSVSFTSRFMQTNRDSAMAARSFLINPNRSTDLRPAVLARVSRACRVAPDMVAINLPDEKVLPAVAGAIAHGAKALMVHAGGFAERGAAGAARQAEFRRVRGGRDRGAWAELPRHTELRQPGLGIELQDGRRHRAPGSIAAISQSGSVASILQRHRRAARAFVPRLHRQRGGDQRRGPDRLRDRRSRRQA